ncbi:hypothetical protein O4H52_16455 [Sphingomonadaceae bacterium G21617-S1]|jgi:hypothetical protein|uniref:hypothetical protein n=1 Tax=Rhizorhabdus sp. TaxID=1968843 RepID=UPI0019C9EF14|nr:hypothetical protein [Rhizorhabdus sp.]MBD3761289.1 hypothetical protein [Rhizorhabdus sp.]MCZ4343210.1 hypothetical protein [Sphingomonadaceae bacterium G21617-S1]
MDLNRLLFDHQIALMRAAATRCTDALAAHLNDAADHAGRIVALRDRMGATAPMPLPCS